MSVRLYFGTHFFCFKTNSADVCVITESEKYLSQVGSNKLEKENLMKLLFSSLALKVLKRILRLELFQSFSHHVQ
jgi:hypothetical protein